MSRRVLAIDAMGGDHGVPVLVDAAVDALAQDSRLHLLLSGDARAIEERLGRHRKAPTGRIEVVPADSVIPSDARPRAILREGKGSSLWNALDRVASGDAHACVSAGNTVALMTLGVKLVGRLEGIQRPALMSYIPHSAGLTGMLDLGANLNVDALALFQFALMGSVVRAGRGGLGDNPTLGLLNVGHEDSKGDAVLQEAHERLQASDLNYEGFIEGHDLFTGRVDVAVCDGFVGNLILKSSEGLAEMLFAELRNTLTSGPRARLGAWLARPALRRMLARLDPDKHNGAPLLGLRGVVVKSHGRSGPRATTHAILEAGREVEKNVPARIAEAVHRHHAEDH
ncbi:MAG: phosphate acyltransferase PlsX [Xanthomonadales bacterium]|nr:phosphate acyltransferase PlsX [Xanthomonadales bacterium]